MAFKEIEKSILKSKFTVSRQTITKDEVGSIVETWTEIYPEIMGILANDSNKYMNDVTGGKTTRTHSMRIPAKFEGHNVIIRENDRVYCKNNRTTYKVTGIERVLNSDGKVHHHLISLDAYRTDMSEPVRFYFESKALIVE